MKHQKCAPGWRYPRFYGIGEPLWRDPLPPVDELVPQFSLKIPCLNPRSSIPALRQRLPHGKARCAGCGGGGCILLGLANQKGPRIQMVLRETPLSRRLDLHFLKQLPLEEAASWLIHFKGGAEKRLHRSAVSLGCQLSRLIRISTA